MRLFISILLVLGSIAVAKDNAISPEMLNAFHKNIENDKNVNAIINAVSHNNATDLAKNRQASHLDDFFPIKVETFNVTDQNSSGRCWLFTSYNVLRHKVIKKHNLKDFEFSTNYGYFWDQLEKANLFLENIIATAEMDYESKKVEWLFKNPIGDGGVWNNAVAITEKYGLVPMYAMPESYNSNNTRTMRSALRLKLRKDGIMLRQMQADKKSTQQIRDAKTKMLNDIYRILVIHLGTPPEKFVWRYKDKDGKISNPIELTPLQFYKDVVQEDMQDYILLMNDPTNEYYKTYEIEWDRSVWEAPNWTFVNLPIQDIKKMALQSLIADESMYFSCDVGKQLDRKGGTLDLANYDYESIYGVDLKMDKKERILSFASASSHGMNLIGVDTTKTGDSAKWLLENSWGSDAGRKGFLVMTDEWFDEYMFRLVVKKEFVPKKIQKIYKEKPVKLLPWNPMYLPMEDQ